MIVAETMTAGGGFGPPPPLQWGRDLIVAETRAGFSPEDSGGAGFNGAAT